MKKVKAGKLVDYKTEAGFTYPALIILVKDDNIVDLQVFATGVSPYQINDVPHSQPNKGADQAINTWAWPLEDLILMT
jgi:hypothetical protein